MSDQAKKEGVLAGVAKLFRPDPEKPAAPPPSCCGECGGEKGKQDNVKNNNPEKAP